MTSALQSRDRALSTMLWKSVSRCCSRLRRRVVDVRFLYISGYVLLWSAQALLIKGSLRKSKSDPAAPASYPYEVLAVTIVIETVKLLIALYAVFFTEQESTGSFIERIELIRATCKEGLLFIIPAAVYGIYNGLAFVNLRLLEPGTYRVLINSRIIFSGILLQVFFSKWLTPRQWAALFLLLTACIIEQSGTFSIHGGVLAIVMMSLQGLCSSLGGVYFQWLLQKQQSGQFSPTPMGLWMKNMYLYIWSIGANIIAIIVFRPDLTSPTVLFANFDFRVVPIVLAAALGGIFTSLLLRHLDVIMKEYANFAEMVVVAVAQNHLFGTPFRATSIIAIFMVSYSLYIYQTCSVPKSTSPPSKQELPLLPLSPKPFPTS